MHETSATPPSAADYQALADLFNDATRALNAGEINFQTFHQRLLEIDKSIRALDTLRKLQRTIRALATQEAKQLKHP